MTTRCGFVAILGAPNAGKSTLLNRLTGAKLSIVSPKAQTTRFRVLGILMRGESQILLVDTPGIFRPRRRLDRAMVAAAWSGARDADLALLLVDAKSGATDAVRGIAERLAGSERRCWLVLNKVDLVPPSSLLPLTAKLTAIAAFEETFMVSAGNGDGLDRLVDALAAAMPEGPFLYPPDELTDLPDRLLAAEIVREQIFRQTHDEVPYAATVETESWQERKDGSVRIEATIYVARPGHKAILIGDRGGRIKDIGARARQELDNAAGTTGASVPERERTPRVGRGTRPPAGDRSGGGRVAVPLRLLAIVAGEAGPTEQKLMEWDAPAIVLDARPYGEGDAVATVMTEQHGLHRGLARGGAARGHSAVWQPGNLVQVRWVARLTDQLGSFSAELIHPAAALAMDDPLALGMLTAICAVAEGALAEREPHPRVFGGLLHLIARLPQGATMLAELVRWEAVLLADLGYGLDLAGCAVTGETNGLAWVSPRTGRAVTEAAAGVWKGRLLRLPAFLVEDAPGTAGDWRDGLRLTGHFLERDAFGHHHRPLPIARRMLYDRVAAMAESAATDSETTDAG